MARFLYPKSYRLKSRQDYLSCKSKKHCFFIFDTYVYYRIRKSFHSRLGCTVTKKQGRAFERNLFRRRVKEAYRINESIRKLPYDIHIAPQAKVAQFSWETIVLMLEEVVRLLNKT